MDTEKQFVVMSKKDVEEMIQQAAVAGAQVASDTMLVAQRRAEKERIDRRLHNTELLLRNYRTLKASCENAVYESRDSKREEVTEILEDIMDDERRQGDRGDLSRRRPKRTALMVQHIDKMLDVYRIYCSKLIRERQETLQEYSSPCTYQSTPMTYCRNFKKIFGQQGHCI